MIRVTTNGVLKGYKMNLTRSAYNLNHARNTVLTERNFNSYAEDPAGATMAFKLRRSYQRTASQLGNNSAVTQKFNSAYTALDGLASSVYNTQKDASSALSSSEAGASDPTASGRAPLGKQLISTAEAMVQTLNSKYGDSFIFAGADGLNVPFTWGADGSLCYRGINVNTTDPGELETLEKLAKESTYVDLGMGMQEAPDGTLIKSSAFDSALCGLDYLGYGVDAEGLPNNLVSVVKEMGEILSRCNPDSGDWDSTADEERYTQLQDKLKEGIDHLTESRTEQSASVTFLKTNQKQLEDSAYTLNEQIMAIEKCDLADAISSFAWAQYCYNAALKVGNSILSQSLIDYMN